MAENYAGDKEKTVESCSSDSTREPFLGERESSRCGSAAGPTMNQTASCGGGWMIKHAGLRSIFIQDALVAAVLEEQAVRMLTRVLAFLAVGAERTQRENELA